MTAEKTRVVLDIDANSELDDQHAWENFDKEKIMQDSYNTMQHYVLVKAESE